MRPTLEHHALLPEHVRLPPLTTQRPQARWPQTGRKPKPHHPEVLREGSAARRAPAACPALRARLVPAVRLAGAARLVARLERAAPVASNASRSWRPVNLASS